MIDYETGAVAPPPSSSSNTVSDTSTAGGSDVSDVVYETTAALKSRSDKEGSGRCDCVAIWVDYELTPSPHEGRDSADSRDSSSTMLRNCSGGDFPTYYTTLLKFFPSPVPIPVAGGSGDRSDTPMSAPTQLLTCRTSYASGQSDFTYSFDVR